MLEHFRVTELYGRLEAETGQAVDWHQVGSLRLPCSPERVMELRRLTTMAERASGLPMEIVSPHCAQELFPLMTTDGVLATAFHSRRMGTSIRPASRRQSPKGECATHESMNTPRSRRSPSKGGGRRRSTRIRGDIACEVVVNAAGMWGLEIGRMAGVRFPRVAVEHQYMLTGPIPDVRPAELRHDADDAGDPDLLVYYKPRRARVSRSADTNPTHCRSATTAYRSRSNVNCWIQISIVSSSWPTLASATHAAG